jgi:hypothetical protein
MKACAGMPRPVRSAGRDVALQIRGASRAPAFAEANAYGRRLRVLFDGAGAEFGVGRLGAGDGAEFYRG